jgi:hypothetical protein
MPLTQGDTGIATKIRDTGSKATFATRGETFHQTVSLCDLPQAATPPFQSLCFLIINYYMITTRKSQYF